jgi:hypothetical protein
LCFEAGWIESVFNLPFRRTKCEFASFWESQQCLLESKITPLRPVWKIVLLKSNGFEFGRGNSFGLERGNRSRSSVETRRQVVLLLPGHEGLAPRLGQKFAQNGKFSSGI